MTTRVETPQTRGRVGFARADITPPVGIYHRMWGAASHEQATGVHRPLTATALWLEPFEADASARLLVLALDHCILDRAELRTIREAVAAAVALDESQVHIALSHTHGSGWMSQSRAAFPGGDLIGPYIERVAGTAAELAKEARRSARPATIVYGRARCSLAAHRDFYDRDRQHFVCGFNPDGEADDTVLVAKAVAADGATLGTLVNYACHPTTLAWQNTLISPDFVGAMREVVERETGAPCLFLQGASGDLGPRDGFVGDTATADRNGRQLGFAALSGLEALPPPGTGFAYAGPVVSGAVLGTWEHRPLEPEALAQQAAWRTRPFVVELPYRLELPTLAETRHEREKWQAGEAAARNVHDDDRARDCRAKVEQMTRQETRLLALPAGKSYPFPCSIAKLGQAVWVFTPGELYQTFQTAVRARFPRHAVVVATLTGDWQPGYLPAAASFGYGIYQDVIAAVGPGSLEVLIESVCREVRLLLG